MSHVELLNTNKLKATSQRLCILDTLEECGHATLEEMQELISEKLPTLSISTIYRNLNEMMQSKIVSKVKIANKKDYFEIIKEKHFHLVCKKCEKIEDFRIGIDYLVAKVERLSNSKILEEALIFSVICEHCQNKP